MMQGDLAESLPHTEMALKFALEAGVIHTVAVSYFGWRAP